MPELDELLLYWNVERNNDIDLLKQAITDSNFSGFRDGIESFDFHKVWQEHASEIFNLLFLTLQYSHFEMTACLLQTVSKKYPMLVNLINQRHPHFGRNALHHMIYLNKLSAVKWLVNNPSIDIDAQNVIKETPIQYAINRYRPKLFSLLYDDKLQAKQPRATLSNMELLQRSIQYYLGFASAPDEHNTWITTSCEPVIFEALLQYIDLLEQDYVQLIKRILNWYSTKLAFNMIWCIKILKPILILHQHRFKAFIPETWCLNEGQRMKLQEILPLLKAAFTEALYQHELERVAALQLNLMLNCKVKNYLSRGKDVTISNMIVKIWSRFYENNLYSSLRIWPWICHICTKLPAELRLKIFWFVGQDLFEPVIKNNIPLLPYRSDFERTKIMYSVFQKLIDGIEKFHQRIVTLRVSIDSNPQDCSTIEELNRLYPPKTLLKEKAQAIANNYFRHCV